MKTKTFLLVCLLSGICLTQLSAQNYSYVNKGAIYTNISWPVYCTDENGIAVLVDNLTGGIETEHHIGHYEKGVWVWCNTQYFGVINGSNGEVFRINEIWKTDITDAEANIGTVTGHIDLNGNKGSHYIMRVILDWNTFSIVEVVNAVCPGSKNKNQ
jgi:hypothetical protein